jgi:hypothetical protein
VDTIPNDGRTSYDDVAVGTQGPHTYAVQALSDATSGDLSSSISVTYDTIPPVLAAPAAVANPNGSVGLGWPDAADPAPGSGISSYIVRRGASPPADPTAGTSVCTVALPAPTGCVDTTVQNGTSYGYSVFALDGAGNVTRQTVSVRAVDTEAPPAVSGFHASMGPTNAHLTWNVPPRQGANSDLAGFRVIRLAAGATPGNPRDGTVVCPGLGFRDFDCFVQNLTTGKRATFAIYAFDEVPNFSAPTILTVTPRGDKIRPHAPTKVRLRRAGARITMTWVSSKDADLSYFIVRLNANGPLRKPVAGRVVFKGRKLQASFMLKAGQVTYANLFAVDLSGNSSPRVFRLIVMPDQLAVPKKKHKAAKKKTAGKVTKPAAGKTSKP